MLSSPESIDFKIKIVFLVSLNTVFFIEEIAGPVDALFMAISLVVSFSEEFAPLSFEAMILAFLQIDCVFHLSVVEPNEFHLTVYSGLVIQVHPLHIFLNLELLVIFIE